MDKENNVPVGVNGEAVGSAPGCIPDAPESVKKATQIDTSACLPVVEIFDSIQGEGSFIGIPATFIRFAGCNLACPFCDSKETWNNGIVSCIDEENDWEIFTSEVFKETGREAELENMDADELATHFKDWMGKNRKYKWLSIEEIVAKVNRPLVVLTGGEPLTQPHGTLKNLIQAIKWYDANAIVCCETNGTQPSIEEIDWVVCSPKAEAGFAIHPGCWYDELKYVVDGKWNPVTKEFIRGEGNFNPEKHIPDDVQKGPAGVVWLQPMEMGTECMQASWAECYKLALEYPYLRVGVQLHKIVGVR